MCKITWYWCGLPACRLALPCLATRPLDLQHDMSGNLTAIVQNCRTPAEQKQQQTKLQNKVQGYSFSARHLLLQQIG